MERKAEVEKRGVKLGKKIPGERVLMELGVEEWERVVREDEGMRRRVRRWLYS